MDGLARLNEKYKIHGAYQNHAGSNFGAPVWDLGRCSRTWIRNGRVASTISAMPR